MGTLIHVTQLSLERTKASHIPSATTNMLLPFAQWGIQGTYIQKKVLLRAVHCTAEAQNSFEKLPEKT